MARSPRRDLIDAAEVGVYHCVQRAVRRAWLCGQDPVTGKNFDHRKVWIQERLAFLAGQFAIDICSIAMMSNHVHMVLRNRPDIAGQWSDEEVARRWWNLFPGRKTEDDKAAEPEPHELAMLMAAGQAGSDSCGIVADPAADAAVARDLGRDGAELRPLVSSGRGARGQFGGGSRASRPSLAAGREPQPGRVARDPGGSSIY